MAELTKEYLDQQLGKLATKEAVDSGFASVDKKFEEIGVLINNAFQAQKDHFDKEIGRLEAKIDALSAKLTTHLELSDKRYLELKRRDTVIAKWLKAVADKTGVKLDLAELDKF